MTKDLLRIKELSVDFSTKQGKVQALKNVSFHIPRGQTLGFVGESGAGKSVTALSIMRLLNTPPAKISSGEILLDNKDLLKLSEQKMQKNQGQPYIHDLSRTNDQPQSCFYSWLSNR